MQAEKKKYGSRNAAGDAGEGAQNMVGSYWPGRQVDIFQHRAPAEDLAHTARLCLESTRVSNFGNAKR